jgi:replication-associated recombination protein RarA
VIGHTATRTILERELPTAVLLCGPPSVGKWTLATHLADHHEVHPVDRWLVPGGLSVDTVRLISSYAARAPFGRFKLIQARLDSSSTQALNALLKTLEEPPPRVRFLLVKTGTALPTVASRCEVYELGALSRAELQAIYQQQGYSTVKAQKAAVYARGQVARGYEVDNDQHRSQVITLAAVLARRDRDAFNAVFRSWDARATQMLTVLLTECLTRRWSMFSEKDAAGLHHDRTRLWQMISALSVLPAARPRLGVRAVLEPFTQGDR